MPVMRETNMTLGDWSERWVQLKHEGTNIGLKLAEVERKLVMLGIAGDEIRDGELHHQLVNERNQLLEVEKRYKNLAKLYGR